MKKALIVMDMDHIILGNYFRIGHIKEIPFPQKVDKVMPLLDIGSYISGISAIGFLE